jgi:hypothetical protein
VLLGLITPTELAGAAGPLPLGGFFAFQSQIRHTTATARPQPGGAFSSSVFVIQLMCTVTQKGRGVLRAYLQAARHIGKRRPGGFSWSRHGPERFSDFCTLHNATLHTVTCDGLPSAAQQRPSAGVTSWNSPRRDTPLAGLFFGRPSAAFFVSESESRRNVLIAMAVIKPSFLSCCEVGAPICSVCMLCISNRLERCGLALRCASGTSWPCGESGKAAQAINLLVRNHSVE